MKVIAFNGSARKDGNTSILIRREFDPLEAEGIETKLVNLGPQSVNGCLACMKCSQNKDGRCVQDKDGLNDWLQEMKAADGIILGTPVYFAQISGQMKCFMDRSGMVSKANGNLLKRKVGAAVVAARRAGTLASRTGDHHATPPTPNADQHRPRHSTCTPNRVPGRPRR